MPGGGRGRGPAADVARAAQNDALAAQFAARAAALWGSDGLVVEVASGRPGWVTTNWSAMPDGEKTVTLRWVYGGAESGFVAVKGLRGPTPDEWRSALGLAAGATEEACAQVRAAAALARARAMPRRRRLGAQARAAAAADPARAPRRRRRGSGRRRLATGPC